MNFGGPRHAVLETEDFRRVLALPRRTVTDHARIAAELTAILKTPDGTMSLRPIQALALYEIGRYGGLFGPIRVGGGKTILSLLVPFILNAKRPVLLLPAALIQKTEDDRRQYAKHWRISPSLRLISYESLGREGQAKMLDFWRPDVVIADEAHRLKNKKAGVTRRVVRYMREDPLTKKKWEPAARPKFVGISGTMLKGGSIKSFAHLLQWSHREGAPIPLEEGELEEWASALDEGSNPFNRTHPGALRKLASDEDLSSLDELTAVRRGFHRRLTETPGVVSTGGDQVACSLYVKAIPVKTNATTEANFLKLRGNGTEDLPGWETPDGWPLSMATEVWRVARELALGFHGIWDPRPPQEWLNARKNWAAFVRETLAHSRTLDTELQVAKACARGDLDATDYDAWQAVKDSFRVNPKDVWHDTAALEACEAWIKRGPGIVWISHSFFGDELERRTGVPYFREEGLDKRGNSLSVLARLITEGKAKAGPILASSFACSTGFNLQPWNRNLLTSCPSGAGSLEQLIGRTHRDGQEADQVEVDVLLGCVENFESWTRARSEAQMAVDTMGDSQKILIADVVDFPSEGEVARTGGPRWTKTKARKGGDE